MPSGVERERAHTVEGEGDAAGIGVRRDQEVVFQLPLIAVVDQVDAGIDAGVFHPGEVGHVALPSRGVVADEVVARARQPFESGELRMRIGADETHAHHGVGLRRVLAQARAGSAPLRQA